jgi:hypothetical protein
MDNSRAVHSFRFTYRSLLFAAKASKRLKRAFDEHRFAPEISAGRAKALLAQMTGYGNWEELKASCDPLSVDPIDQELSSSGIAERRDILSRRLAKLMKMKFLHVAKDIVDRSEPTGSRSGLFRYDGYFDIPKHQVGMTDWDAFSSHAQRAPAIFEYACIKWLRSFEQPNERVTVVDADHHEAISVRRDGDEVLRVQYLRHARADLFDFMEYDDDADEPDHPTPLKPSHLHQLVVGFDIVDMQGGFSGANYDADALEAAHRFLLVDGLVTTLLCAHSVDATIATSNFVLDINEDRPEMVALAGYIESSFEHIVSSDQERDRKLLFGELVEIRKSTSLASKLPNFTIEVKDD